MASRSVSSALAAMMALLAAGPVLAADKALDRSFEVETGGRLRVELDAGHIIVTGGDASRVAVKLRARGTERELDDLEWSAVKDDEGVLVQSERDDAGGLFGWFLNDVHVTATIEVPREYQVDLVTSGGKIELRHLTGDANGRTSGGRITIDDVRGHVQMRTSGGAIAANAIDGPVQLHTSGGAIQASHITGGLRAHTSGGRISVEQSTGPIDVHTSGGSIAVDLAGENEGVTARTSGGSITMRVPSTLRADLNASTSGGRVKSDFPVTTTETSNSSLRGTINGGGATIMARSSGGSIHLLRRD